MFKYLVKVSRPRFWHYIIGPFLVGALIAFNADPVAMFRRFDFWIWFLYFWISANFLIYGINDLADTDTDEFNSKKELYEVKFDKNKFKLFVGLFLVLNLPILFFTKNIQVTLFMLAFWFFSCFYSIEPIRAKAKPFIDSAFNFLYVLPGIIGYLQFSNNSIAYLNWSIIAAATFWSMAMHTFSAIPDIKADKQAELNTTAVFLGLRGALIYCFSLYSMAGILGLVYFNKYILVLAIPYLIAMLFCYYKNNSNTTFAVYKLFPTYNLIAGLGIFWLVYFTN